MALHEQSVGKTSEWYTPAQVFKAMGVWFDLDVASPTPEPLVWIPADAAFSEASLEREWRGFVWMNPPFGGRNGIVPWLNKFFDHGNGVALTPDRTSAPWWQAFARRADAILFVHSKLKFIGADGQPGMSPAQGTTLFASGPLGRAALDNAADAGLGLLMYPSARGS